MVCVPDEKGSRCLNGFAKLRNVLIGLTLQYDKLLFEWERSKLPAIANQSADWCGNPPVERNQVTITAKNLGVF